MSQASPDRIKTHEISNVGINNGLADELRNRSSYEGRNSSALRDLEEWAEELDNPDDV